MCLIIDLQLNFRKALAHARRACYELVTAAGNHWQQLSSCRINLNDNDPMSESFRNGRFRESVSLHARQLAHLRAQWSACLPAEETFDQDLGLGVGTQISVTQSTNVTANCPTNRASGKRRRHKPSSQFISRNGVRALACLVVFKETRWELMRSLPADSIGCNLVRAVTGIPRLPANFVYVCIYHSVCKM